MDSTLTRARKLFETDDHLAIWFQLLCENGTQAIEAQAWQVAADLKRDEDEVRDAMLELAHELLPDSPAGTEDPRDTLLHEYLIWGAAQDENVRSHLARASEDGFEDARDSGLHEFRKYLRARCKLAMSEEAA